LTLGLGVFTAFQFFKPFFPRDVSVYAGKLAMTASASPGTSAAEPAPTADRKVLRKYRVTETSNRRGNQHSAAVNSYSFYSQDFSAAVFLST